MLQRSILVIEEKKDIYNTVKKIFEKENQYNIVFCINDNQQIKQEALNFPDVILINLEDYLDVYEKLKEYADIDKIPILLFFDNEGKEKFTASMKNGINLCISKPIDKELLYYTIKNYITLISSNRTVSPLTGLPGNVQISNELKRRLMKKQEFAVLYCDLDNFKAYNDKYGFMKGDDVIKLTADTIALAVRKYGQKEDFLGHIGGDDFIAITSSENIERICNEIIAKFDKSILKLLTNQDVERGFFEVPNRRGIIEQYPLTSISIGVVKVEKDKKLNLLEIGEIGAQVKHKAKTIPGSAFVISEREMNEEE